MSEPSTEPQPEDETGDMSDFSDTDALLADASKYGTALSISLCTLAIVTFVLIRRYQPKLANRVSLRLAMAGTICDILYAISVLLSALPTGPSALCTSSMYLQIVFLLLSLFITAAIGLNVFLIFILHIRSVKYLERLYYGAGAVLAIIIPLPALLTGRLGWDGTECWYANDQSEEDVRITFYWQCATYYSWVILAVGFCALCTILFWITTRKPPNDAIPQSEIDQRESGTFRETERLLRMAVNRIKWYCAVPLIAQIFSLAADIQYYIYDSTPLGLWWMANFMSGFHGALNTIVFFGFDPSVRHAGDKLRAYLVYHYYLRLHTVDTFRSTSVHSVQSRSPLTEVPSVALSSEASTPRLDKGSMWSSQRLNRPAASAASSPVDELPLKDSTELKLRSQPSNKLAFHFVRIFLLKDADKAKFIKQKRNQMQKREGAVISRANTVQKLDHYGSEAPSDSGTGVVKAMMDSINAAHERQPEAIELL
ncbi:uncharacterized protein SPPG_01384 [Spizellomyces punctatus DAOM BR117]|uniref:G-protein coupled receptors family 2 profile 2 domain-containing protein n=1 Tax=Spizellomyces punctatus (strain DAOM BR117) TaxID=645134 RepID=A0A0L0HST0_SPIPD|nr:uncharacterized protein SPPG_01384 [Spizellomyces punctatus DAOM BR117]KND03934.1 hypothetical protein SPPG_01384 [Spizellomyces punctatus DAOM BR117]|eukprot:XP_016611973.1 hypothetical protein SPPG_01384 [Spizellomyces punctatus DAOM BR117]